MGAVEERGEGGGMGGGMGCPEGEEGGMGLKGW